QATYWLRQSARQGYGKARLSMQTLPGATLTPRATPSAQATPRTTALKKQRATPTTVQRLSSPAKKSFTSKKAASPKAVSPVAASVPAESVSSDSSAAFLAQAGAGNATPIPVANTSSAPTSQGEVVASSVPSRFVDSAAPVELPAPIPNARSEQIAQETSSYSSPLGGFGAQSANTAESSYVPTTSTPETASLPPPVATARTPLPEQPPVLHFRMVDSGQEPGVVRGGAVEQDLSYPAHQPASVPTARYVDNGNGTITDRLRGLVGLKNANCFGRQMWEVANTAIHNLADGQCQLQDQSRAGDWRLLSRDEMHILLDWQESGLFEGVIASGYYWSSTPHEANPGHIWYLMPSKGMLYNGSQERKNASWPVRALRR
uniref:Lcl C-terminal domain-containing protein n=1 Tax=Candidatus Magnetaquicoccus inordinatus TaxID=2496818 RepID=UPI00102B9E7B